MTRAPRLGDDLGHLVDLPLRTAEGTELGSVSIRAIDCANVEWAGDSGVGEEMRRTLFFARRRARLSLEFRSNSMTRFSYLCTVSISWVGQLPEGYLRCKSVHNRTLAGYSTKPRFRDSHDFWILAPYTATQSRNPAPADADVHVCVTYPATSRVISLTKAVRFDRKPFLREILGAGCLGVTSVHRSQLVPYR